MSCGFIERVMRHLGLSAGEIPHKTHRASELEAQIEVAEQKQSAARALFNRSTDELQLDSYTKAHRLSEIGQAVRGVTLRLEDKTHG